MHLQHTLNTELYLYIRVHRHNYKQSKTSPHEAPCMKLCSLRYRKYIKPYYYNCNYYNRIHSAYTCMLPFFFLYTTTPHVPAIHMKSPSHAPDDAPAVLIHSCPSLPNCALICLKSLTSQPSFFQLRHTFSINR